MIKFPISTIFNSLYLFIIFILLYPHLHALNDKNNEKKLTSLNQIYLSVKGNEENINNDKNKINNLVILPKRKLQKSEMKKLANLIFNKRKLSESVSLTEKDITSFFKVFRKLHQDLQNEFRYNIKSGMHENDECPKIHLRNSDKGPEIIVLNTGNYKEITLSDLIYKKPSQWSPCTRSCKTQRIRKCRIPTLCFQDILVEEAYCYFKQTKCETKVTELLKNELKQEDKDNTDYNNSEDTDYLYNYDYKDTENDYNGIDNEDFSPIVNDSSHVIINIFGDYDYNYYDYYAYTNRQQEDTSYESRHHKKGTVSPVTDNMTLNPDAELISPENTNNLAEGNCGKAKVSIPYKMFRIIGGKEAVKGSWPWQAALLNRFKEVFCGGTVIGSRWILTAAHCVRKKLYVRVGEHDIMDDDGEMEIKVTMAFVNPNFDIETIDSDIALLKLKSDILNKPSRAIQKACLPTASQESPPVKDTCVILGWGKERESHIFGSFVLRYAEVPIVGNKACKKVYDYHDITSNMFCAGYMSGGIDACEGDSGGPLLCKDENQRWVIHGVTSFGDGCGEKGRLGVYVKVSNFLDWINKTMAEN